MSETDEKEQLVVAGYIIWIVTGILIAIPVIPTFWLWMPLAFVGCIMAIVMLCRGKIMHGLIGLGWTLIGSWLWWIVTGIVTSAILSTLGAGAGAV
jgi:hypothetical protein